MMSTPHKAEAEPKPNADPSAVGDDELDSVVGGTVAQLGQAIVSDLHASMKPGLQSLVDPPVLPAGRR